MTADAVGGVWQYSLDLIASLVRQDAEVLLVTQGPEPSAEQLRQLEEIPRARWKHLDVSLEWMPDGFNEFSRACRAMLEFEREFQADLIHLNGYSLAVAPWKAPVVVVAHSCVFSWWQAVHHNTPDGSWAEYRERVTQGLEAASEIVAPSDFMRDSISLHYGIAPERVRVIHNFSTAPVTKRGEKQPYVLAVGRMWDRAKNMQLLRTIANDLVWPLRVAGGDEAVLTEGSISYLGRLSHEGVLAQMAEASIFVHPAVYEPFGLAVLEAARSGCCLVLADTPSLRELWDGAAIFLRPDDSRGWIEQINWLSRNRDQREELAARATASAGRFHGEDISAEYRHLYERAILRKAAAGVAA